MKSTEANYSTRFNMPVLENKTIPEIAFSTGDRVFIDTAKEQLELVDKNGMLQLTISIKEKGLVIQVNASSIQLNAAEELNLSGKKINITAAEQLNIKTKGNLVQQVDKDALMEVGGTNKMLAMVQKITATLGDVTIKANDDVKLNGERVKMNCD